MIFKDNELNFAFGSMILISNASLNGSLYMYYISIKGRVSEAMIILNI